MTPSSIAFPSSSSTTPANAVEYVHVIRAHSLASAAKPAATKHYCVGVTSRSRRNLGLGMRLLWRDLATTLAVEQKCAMAATYPSSSSPPLLSRNLLAITESLLLTPNTELRLLFSDSILAALDFRLAAGVIAEDGLLPPLAAGVEVLPAVRGRPADGGVRFCCPFKPLFWLFAYELLATESGYLRLLAKLERGGPSSSSS